MAWDFRTDPEFQEQLDWRTGSSARRQRSAGNDTTVREMAAYLDATIGNL